MTALLFLVGMLCVCIFGYAAFLSVARAGLVAEGGGGMVRPDEWFSRRVVKEILDFSS